MSTKVSTKLRILNFMKTLFHKIDKQTDLRWLMLDRNSFVNAPKKVKIRKDISG